MNVDLLLTLLTFVLALAVFVLEVVNRKEDEKLECRVSKLEESMNLTKLDVAALLKAVDLSATREEMDELQMSLVRFMRDYLDETRPVRKSTRKTVKED